MNATASSEHAGREAIGIVATGIGNIESVGAAFRRLERSTYRVETRDQVTDASFLVLPGVGSFASGMAALTRHELADPLRERIREGRPTLVIALGLQLLCEASEEAPGVSGLGCIPGRVARFGPEARVPHVGWSLVHAGREAQYLISGGMYFANSYRLPGTPDGWVSATSRHGATFVAALERRGVLACQFHPELSGVTGRRLLSSWLETAGRAEADTVGRHAGIGRFAGAEAVPGPPGRIGAC